MRQAPAPAPIRVLGRPVRRQALGRGLDEVFDRVGDVHLHDRAIAPRDAQIVRGEQYVGAGEALRRIELPARQLDQEPERILEVDRVEHHPVAHPGVGNAARA